MRNFDCDVLVVGMGPVGDTLAGLLQQRDLHVIAIDAAAGTYPLPRAAVFDHEVMRIFQELHLADRILPDTRVTDRYQFLTSEREVLLDFPVPSEGTVSGWAGSYYLHQPAVEDALRMRLAETGVDTRLSTALIGLTQDESGVTARVRSSQGEYTLRSRYLVGCDGAGSPVRTTLGIELSDYQFDEPWLVIDAIATGPHALPLQSIQICDPERPTTYLAMSGRRYRWEFMLKPGEDPAQIVEDKKIRELLAPWNCAENIEIERKAVYRFHGLVAQHWREGRVLIAGDAAHQMPPFAGQGMCSGIRDAANLAWKLEYVLKNLAEPALLDSYQTEREPHVRAIIETAIAMGRVVCMQDPQAAKKRDTEMLARRASGEQNISVAYPSLKSGVLMDAAGGGALFPQVHGADGPNHPRMDDVFGPGAWLIGRDLPGSLPQGLRSIDLGKDEGGPFAHELGKWLAKNSVKAVLVRPDRHVFGTGRPKKLIEEWTRLLPAALPRTDKMAKQRAAARF